MRKYFSDGKYVFLNSILERATFFIFYLILARTISKTEFGIVTTIFSFINILQAIFDFGFPFYLQREAATGNNFQKKLNTVLVVRLISFFLFLLIPLIYFSFAQTINYRLVFLISLTNFLLSLSLIFTLILYGKNLYKNSFILLCVSRASFFLVLIILLLLNSGLEVLLLAFVFSSIVYFIALITPLKKIDVKINLKLFSFSELKEIMRSSLPMGVGLIFVMMYDRIDILLIQQIIDYKTVAVYSIAYSLYRALQIFSSTINTPAFSYYSNHYSMNKSLPFVKIKKDFSFLLLMSLSLIIAAFLFADPVVRFFYGDKYFASIDILKYLSLALPGIFLNNFTGVLSNSIRKEYIPVISTGVALLVNIFLNLALLKAMGIIGAVIATIATEYVVFLIQFLFLFPKLKLKTI